MQSQEATSSDLNCFEDVISNTVKMLDSSRRQLLVAAGNARNEYLRVKELLIDLDDEIVKAGSEQRNQLKKQRKELEGNLSGIAQRAEKAEGMVAQVQLVMDLLKGNHNDMRFKIEDLQQKQQLGLQIIKAQEEERKRVAREIHDGPAQSLANVVFRMEYCEKLLEMEPNKVKDELVALKNVVKDNLQDVRKIIYDLRPMALDDLGIIPALRRYINNYREEKGIIVEFSFSGKEVRVESGLEVALFRIIQEALTNVAKHAAASYVSVGVEMRDDFISAVIEDDGRGLDLPGFLNSKASNFGLISMRERADLLGGELYINTLPGKGTKISLRLPINGEGK